MAQRGREDPLACRFADRGNNRVIPGPCARGKDQSSTHRTADRGNGGVGPDPWDLKIKQLKQRVRNLEIQQEIKRLRKRIRYLKLRQDTCKTETELSTIVRDEGGDREQQPFSHYPHRFYEPIYPKGESQDEPKFDEDGMHHDEKEYLWVQQAISGVTNRDNEEEEAIHEHENSSVASGMFVELLREDTVVREKSCYFSKVLDMSFWSKGQPTMECTTKSTEIKEVEYSDNPITLLIQIDGNDEKKLSHRQSKEISLNIVCKNSTCIKSNITCECEDICKSNMVASSGLQGGMETGDDVPNSNELIKDDGLLVGPDNLSNKVGKLEEEMGSFAGNPRNINLHIGNASVEFKLKKPMVNLMLLKLEDDETFSKTERMMRVGNLIGPCEIIKRILVTVKENRVDVPFDPGIYGKTRGESFLRRGV